MSAEHFGVWSRLHIASHLEEVTGTLPNDDVELTIAAGFSIETVEGVERWLAMKAKVMEDWLLCTDGRWHHPSRARNVLHIWIGGRERDRRSALGNKSKSVKARATIAALEDAIEYGRDALARIDPTDRFLQGLDERISRWPSKADSGEAPVLVEAQAPAPASSVSYYDDDGPDYVRNTTPTVTVNETKRSEVKRKESSSPQSGDDSSASPNKDASEIGKTQGSAKRTPLSQNRENWPPGWFETFKGRYPKRETGQAWGRAEKALERIRKAGKVSFEEIMAGVDWMLSGLDTGRLKAQYTPLASNWLDGRGWEDRLVLPVSRIDAPSGRSPPDRPASEPSITHRAAMRAAERLGLLDEPRPRG